LAQRRRSAIYSRLRDYTMIPAHVFSSNLKLATRVAVTGLGFLYQAI
jgi:hypothetical protein